MICPGRVRIRDTVAGDTVVWWCWARCQQMVCGPASVPCSVSSLRSRSDQVDDVRLAGRVR